jgi:biotin carboxyl carrier protein
VQLNDLLLVLDAMKMEIKINAQSPGTVKSVDGTKRSGQAGTSSGLL